MSLETESIIQLLKLVNKLYEWSLFKHFPDDDTQSCQSINKNAKKTSLDGHVYQASSAVDKQQTFGSYMAAYSMLHLRSTSLDNAYNFCRLIFGLSCLPRRLFLHTNIFEICMDRIP